MQVSTVSGIFMKAVFPMQNKSRTDKQFSRKPVFPTLGERCVSLNVQLSLFYRVVDLGLGWTIWGIESGGAGDTSCCDSFHSNRTWYMS